MLRRSCLVGLLLVYAAFLAFAGCSSDSTKSDKVVGDPNASDFQNMKAAIASAVDSTLAATFRFACAPWKVAPADTHVLRPDWGVLNPEDTLLYNYIDGWHILHVGLTTGIDYNNGFVDSARFWIDMGSIDRYFSYHVNTIDYIHHQTNTYKGIADDYQNSASWLNVLFTDFDIAAETRVTGNGSFVIDDYYQEQATTVHDNYEFGITVNQVGFHLTQNHPWTETVVNAGQLTMTASVTSGTTTAGWTVTAAFNTDGTAEIEAVNGKTVYEYQMTPAYQ